MRRFFNRVSTGENPASGSADLFAAVERNDSDGIRNAVKAGKPIDSIRQDGITPLILAISLNHTESVKTLLDLGADPDVASSEHLIAMDFARGKGVIEIEDAVMAATRRRSGKQTVSNEKGPIVSGVARDLANFLD